MQPPFDTELLDHLMDQAGIDVLCTTSKHNVQYLLGGYRFFFFDTMDAIGVSRYLPILIYPKGKPENSVYIGNAMESHELDVRQFWLPTVETSTWGTIDAIDRAVQHLTRLGPFRTIGIEGPFLPSDASKHLLERMPKTALVDSVFILERLRAVKSDREIHLLREASERVVASMLSALAQYEPAMTKKQFVDKLRLAEIDRGLSFDYCLLTAGASHNRAPSDQVIQSGDVLSIDSGGNFEGYIGDLARMGIVGPPDGELNDLLTEVEIIQQAARRVIKPNSSGVAIYEAADEARRRSSHANYTHFMAHGMGLVSHEAPRLSGQNPIPYPGYDSDRPLVPGLVISVETTMTHPTRGYIKLEDTIAVTRNGNESLGDGARGWNLAGQRP